MITIEFDNYFITLLGEFDYIYNMELYKSLRNAGVSRMTSVRGIGMAIQEQFRNRKMPWNTIDNIPGRTAPKNKPKCR